MAQLDRCVLMELTHYPIHQASIHASGSGFSLHAEPALRCARECSADWRVRQERGSLCGARDATSRASAEKKNRARAPQTFGKPRGPSGAPRFTVLLKP
jgi:hypothetical protein